MEKRRALRKDLGARRDDLGPPRRNILLNLRQLGDLGGHRLTSWKKKEVRPTHFPSGTLTLDTSLSFCATR